MLALGSRLSLLDRLWWCMYLVQCRRSRCAFLLLLVQLMMDCSGITQDELSTRLAHLLPAGLRYLVLEQCGRCVGPKTVQTMVQAAPDSSLFALAIAGAYLLKDDDAASLIQAISKTLSSLELRACPRLGIQVCKALSNSFAAPRCHETSSRGARRIATTITTTPGIDTIGRIDMNFGYQVIEPKNSCCLATRRKRSFGER